MKQLKDYAQNEEQKEIKQQVKLERLKERYENFKPLNMLSKSEFDSSGLNYKDYDFRKYGCIMRFFEKIFSKWVNNMKSHIIAFSFLWLACSCYLGTQISRQIPVEALLSEDNPI